MNQKIILLADDDVDDTEMFCEAIENIDKSIVCHCAVNGKELLNKLNALVEKPQLIFLDVNMPVINGWECLRMLKEDEKYRNIPVIMISTSSHKKEMDIAWDLGALCYFIKPNNFNELSEVLEAITANLGTTLLDTLQNIQNNGSSHIFIRTNNDSIH
jgi:CheY-like chemotaxis protein